MAENRITIKGLEGQAFRKRIKSHLLGIIVSVGVIIVTAVLVYFYPKMESNKRLLFLISCIWPSGVIVVLVPMWTEFIRDLRDNIGHDIYKVLEEEVSQKFADSPKEGDTLLLITDRRNELKSTDKATRKKALQDILDKING